MSNLGELTVAIQCDPSDLTAGMTAARDQIEQTTTVIQLQDETWRSFASSAVGSIAQIVAPILRLVNTYKQIQLATIVMASANAAAIAPTLGLAGAVNFLLSPVVLTAAAVAACAAAVYYFSGASEGASASTQKAGGSAKEAAEEFTLLESVVNSVTAAGQELFGDEIVSKIGTLLKETDNLSGNLKKLKEDIEAPFLGGVSALQEFVVSTIPAVRAVGDINAALKTTNQYLKDITPSIGAAASSFAAMVLSFGAGISNADAADIVGAGDAINKQEAVIENMKTQQSSFKAFADIQKDASDSAKRAAEVSQVASITTIEGINSQILAMQEKARETILAKKDDEDWAKTQQALFDALEKQRQGILNGTVIDKAAEEEKRKLQKIEEETRKIIKNGEEETRKRNEDGAKRIQSLRDEIDLLSGAATKAEVEMRKMAESGFSEEQATEVGRLTAELEQLKKEEADAKKTDNKKDGKTLASAAEFGSKSALSIIANASAGRDPVADNTKKIASEAVKQTGHLQKIATEVGDFQNVSVVELPA